MSFSKAFGKLEEANIICLILVTKSPSLKQSENIMQLLRGNPGPLGQSIM